MKEKEYVYLDNAATTFPKPQQVIDGMLEFMCNIGGNPGRSGHKLSRDADKLIWETRDLIAKLIGAQNSYRIVFTNNATTALNWVLKGYLKANSQVIVSPYEHNSVLRPLTALGDLGIKYSVVELLDNGEINLESLLKSVVTLSPQLLIINHISNVCGYMMPLNEICEIAKKHSIPILLDASQSMGAHPFDLNQYPGIAFIAFSGHKSLFGPQGTGVLYIAENYDVLPTVQGGTGSRSDSLQHPDWLPDSLESGTLNGVGIAGLKKGVEYIISEGTEKIQRHNQKLSRKLISGMLEMPFVKLYGCLLMETAPNVISFTINGMDPAETSHLLDTKYGVMSRSGLHCAPLAHKALGTFSSGTVRLSISYLNDDSDIEIALDAIANIATKVSSHG